MVRLRYGLAKRKATPSKDMDMFGLMRGPK